MQQFSRYAAMRPSQNGRQTCNACRAAFVQATVRKQAATATARRLQRLRHKLWHTNIIRETWEAIAQHKAASKRTLRAVEDKPFAAFTPRKKSSAMGNKKLDY